jgi:hypothetical protein
MPCALLGIVGEDKLRPYELNHNWVTAVRTDLACPMKSDSQ